jgi:ATP-dependent Clp protease ATP-binding subunit ClpA
MFERFTESARQVVRQSQVQARALHHPWIGTEHLLLALAHERDSISGRTLRAHGVDHDRVAAGVARYIPADSDDLDAGALETIGIDLSAVRERVEASFGPGALDLPPGPRACRGGTPGHLPFTPRSKKTLELALREALRLKHNHIADGHLLLGILREGEGLAARILADAGVDVDALRRDIIAAMSRSAGGSGTAATA